MSDPRHNARILAVQYLFENSFPGITLTDKTGVFDTVSLLEIDEEENYDEALYKRIVSNLPQYLNKIDKLIVKLAPEWPLDKIAHLDLHILRIAILEGFFLQATPEKVAIDEAIELAKEFSNDQSRKFISGVLGNLFENKPNYQADIYAE